MKRLSFFKKLSLGIGATAAVTPIVLMATSCGVTSCTVDFIDFKSIVDNGSYSKATTSNVAFRKVLYGSKKIYGGNYVVFVGSNMFDSTRTFFSGDTTISTKEQWYGEYFKQSHFYKGIDSTTGPGQPAINNFGIYNCIDFWDRVLKDKKGHQIFLSRNGETYNDTIGPWEVWTEQLITTTKTFNKLALEDKPSYDWDDKSVAKDEYIRNDAEAQAFRALCKEGLTIFPTTDKRKTSFNVANNNTDSRMVIFKDGKLVDIAAIPSTPDAWKEIITKNYKVEEKK